MTPAKLRPTTGWTSSAAEEPVDELAEALDEPVELAPRAELEPAEVRVPLMEPVLTVELEPAVIPEPEAPAPVPMTTPDGVPAGTVAAEG